MAEADFKHRVEERINQGLLGQWYVVARSADLPQDKPLAVKALGRRLVLWRSQDGVNCIEDNCPHRGAPLSRGEILEGHIACRYHGLVINGEGRILQVPAMPECSLEGRKALVSYETREACDAVFAYFPSLEQPEPYGFELPYELEDPEYAHFLVTAPWDCSYRYALDNIADPMHGCYLHADSFTLAYGAKQDLMEIEETQDGFVISRVGQRGANFDWTEIITNKAAMYCRLDIPYPEAGGPGGPMRILTFVTPVNDNNCRIFFWRTRKVSGVARESWRFLYRATLEPRHWHVLEQDREMLGAMPPKARKREMLYQHDIGVSRLRRILISRAKAQIEREDASALQAAG